MIIKKSKDHLKESQSDYKEHFVFAIWAFFLLFYASITSLIHAFIPAFFKGTPAYIVIRLYHKRLINHPNLRYQQWIKDENNNQKNT